MSVRNLLVTDPTDPDYGKISPNYIPSSVLPPTPPTPVPPTPTPTQGISIIKSGLIGTLSTEITPVIRVQHTIWSLGYSDGTAIVTAPLLIGPLDGCQNVQLVNNNNTKVIIKAQIIANNLVVKFPATTPPTPPIVPPKKLTIQFYLDVIMGDNTNFDANQQQVFKPIVPTDGTVSQTLATIGPVIDLYYNEAVQNGIGMPPDSYYYCGLGTITDWFTFAIPPEAPGLVKSIDLYGCFIDTNGLTLEGVKPDVVNTALYGSWNYMLTFEDAN